MDMKKILESLDNIKSNDSRILNEDSNRLSTAEQMIMQQYSAPKKKKPSVIKKYFESVEQEILEEQNAQKQAYAQKARSISEKLMNESKPYYQPGKSSKMSKHLAQSKRMPDSVRQSAKNSAARMIGEDEVDTVTLDIPLLLRIMEYSKEDAKTDMDLHYAVEKMIELNKQSDTLSMDHYDTIIGNQKLLDKPDNMQESNNICRVCGQTPCNCTSINESSSIDEVSSELLSRYKKAASADATQADEKGEFERGNKRFSGIIKATKKQLSNDLKNHKK